MRLERTNRILINMDSLKIAPDVADRLRTFIGSQAYLRNSRSSRSDYWKQASAQLGAVVHDDSVDVGGQSGFYVPPPSSLLKRTARKVSRALAQPSAAGAWLFNRLASPFRVPRLMSYAEAFDVVMRHGEISDPDLSPFRVNHLELARNPKVFPTVKSIASHYEKWSGNQATHNVITHYYYQNLLRSFISEDRLGTVVEIGPGNGNFASILHHDWSPDGIILVDLPETLAIAIPFLHSLFPRATLIMPNEAEPAALAGKFDFAFLTNEQLELVQENSIDLAINCHSFQEMTHAQIGGYFRFVQRVTVRGGLFFTANRVEKIPCNDRAYSVEQEEPPNRFAEYPWDARNEVLVYEVSRLSRLAQLDAVSIRLERIHK